MTTNNLAKNEEVYPAFPFVTQSLERYEVRACECEEWANSIRDIGLKQMLFSLAQRWGDLAEKIREHGDRRSECLTWELE